MSPPPENHDATDSARVSPTDVSRRAVEIFGDSTAKAPAAADSGPSWDIDVHSYESTARVEHYVRLFTGPAKDHIETRLERGTRYEPMIRAKMREGGLPEDMYYLALVESGFDPNAYSRAAAVGMWQFMTSTARDMGLRVDWWVDERRDPVKSTVAAVRFIKDLKEQFGSLYLAAAAYNGGPGRVARGLTRYADDARRNERRRPVLRARREGLSAQRDARVRAAADRRGANRQGARAVRHDDHPAQPPFVYDSVRVGPATPMAAVAHAAGTQLSDAAWISIPQVLRGITPPKDSSFLRLPAGAADSFAVAFANLPKSERLGTTNDGVEEGRELRVDCSARGHRRAAAGASITRRSSVLKSGNLVPGQTVLVPTAAVASAAVAVPDPASSATAARTSSCMHVVKTGETLGGIAKKYHTTTAVLMKRNGLRRAIIFPGQSLVVAAKAPGAPKTAAKKPTSKAPAKSVKAG